MMAMATLVVSEVDSDNGKAGYTGSTGEGNCHSCHASYTLNSGGGSIFVSGNIPATGWVPGTVYQMSVTVKKTGISLFGIGLEGLDSLGANSGTITPTGGKCYTRAVTVSGKSRTNMVHNLNGGTGTDSCVFAFNWTAPAASSTATQVHFYYAGAATNANGSDVGDYVYTGNKIFYRYVAPNATKQVVNAAISVYPNPTSDFLRINLSDVKGMNTVSIFNLEGKLMMNQTVVGGSVAELSLPSSMMNGVYLVRINNENGTQTQKISVVR